MYPEFVIVTKMPIVAIAEVIVVTISCITVANNGEHWAIITIGRTIIIRIIIAVATSEGTSIIATAIAIDSAFGCHHYSISG